MITIKLTIYTDGSKIWCQNDKYHRDNDQPAIIHADGSKGWCQNGEFIKQESK